MVTVFSGAAQRQVFGGVSVPQSHVAQHLLKDRTETYHSSFIKEFQMFKNILVLAYIFINTSTWVTALSCGIKHIVIGSNLEFFSNRFTTSVSKKIVFYVSITPLPHR